MKKKYIVKLSDEERNRLTELTTKGKAKVRRVRRARILLLADEGFQDDFITFAVGCGRATVERIRKRCVLEGLEAALSEKPRPGGKPKLSGDEEALVVALACSDAPNGQGKWTLQMLADKVVELTDHESLSYETVRKALKKTSSNPGNANSGV